MRRMSGPLSSAASALCGVVLTALLCLSGVGVGAEEVPAQQHSLQHRQLLERAGSAASGSGLGAGPAAYVVDATGGIPLGVGGGAGSFSDAAGRAAEVEVPAQHPRRSLLSQHRQLLMGRAGQRVLTQAPLPPPPPTPMPPPPEPNDAFSATVATLADLRDQMIQPKILTIYLTANITLDGRELPAVEKQLRILGACGSDGFAACWLDANKASRHCTVGMRTRRGCAGAL